MKKLLGILVLGLLLGSNAVAEIIDLNKCFTNTKKGKVVANSWEESTNKSHIGKDPKPTEEKYSRKIVIYKGPLSEDNIYSINGETGIVTNILIWKDAFLRALLLNERKWRRNNPEQWERVKTENNTNINLTELEYKKKTIKTKYVIDDYAGKIVFAHNKSEYLNRKAILEINLDKNEIYTWAEPIDKSKSYLGFPNSKIVCNNNSSATDESNNTSGTAFFINNKGNLLTNNHVVEGCKLSKINYFNKEYETNLISTDKTLDLALLKVDLKPKSFISFSNKEPKKRQLVTLAGYPLGIEFSDDLKINDGKISSLKGFENNSNEITIDIAINHGNSGGPIVDAKNGQLVAVAVSGMSKEFTEGISFGIKSSAVTNFLKTNKISPDIKLTSFSMNDEKVTQLLEESTVYIFCEK